MERDARYFRHDLTTEVPEVEHYQPTVMPDLSKGFTAFKTAVRANWAELRRIDREQREKGELAGRYVTHPVDRHQTVYQVTEVGYAHARLKLCKGLGRDLEQPAWRPEVTMNKHSVESLVLQRQALEDLFLEGEASA